LAQRSDVTGADEIQLYIFRITHPASIYPQRLRIFPITSTSDLCASTPYLRDRPYVSRFISRYSARANRRRSVPFVRPAPPRKCTDKTQRSEHTMRARTMIGLAALALGAACATAPAFAAPKQGTSQQPTYSNMGPKGAPLSPNGAGAGASAFGGPGFNGPYADQTNVKSMQFSTMGPKGAPLSPNGSGAGASAFGGPGYNGPYADQTNVKPMQFSTTGPKGAPLSPNGAGAGASAYGGPGYQM
jgi:hypothetical protein